MLSQMLQEDRSEEVRRAVVKNLGIILSFVTDARKYSQVCIAHVDVINNFWTK